MTVQGKNKEKKKKAVIALTAAAGLALIAGTFAWTSYTEWVKNHMQSSGIEEGKVSIVEVWPTPEISLEMTKKVSVANASNVDVFVRVSFEEMLQRLGDNADGKGYATLADAKFPVVMNPADYKSAAVGDKSSAGWVDISDKLRINGTAPTLAADAATPGAGTDGYKLYQKDDSYTIFYVKNMKKTEWPADFNFDLSVGATSKKIPMYTGDYATDAEGQVAQKVSGHAVKQPDGSINFLAETGGATDLEYYGYGQDLTAEVEKDWAGLNNNLSPLVTAPTLAPAADFAQSQADGEIKFNMPNAAADATIAGHTKDWWYNDKDGFYYYTKALPANSTTDASVLDSVKFPANGAGKLDNSYMVASYNLFVGMEAIPAYQSALKAPYNGKQIGSVGDASTDGSGWNLQPGTSNGVYEYFAAISIPE